MPAALLPKDETSRLTALRSYGVLDTACEAAFDNIAELTAKLTGCPISCISLIDTDRQWFKARYGTDAPGMPREHSFCAHAILDPGRPLVVPDLANDQRFSDNPFVTGGPQVRFYAGAPLVNPEGAALGTLCVLDLAPRSLNADQQHTLVRLAETAMTTLELRRTVTKLHRMALVDGLTGLPNRVALIEALERVVAQSRRTHHAFGLLYLDLDGFKQVNDRRGHAVGDAVLFEVGAVLRANLRTEDVAARLGGDEFAALLIGADGDVERVARRIRAEIAQVMNRREWAVTASIGAVTFSGSPKNADEAIAAADALMYDAKATGKNRVVYGSYPSSRHLRRQAGGQHLQACSCEYDREGPLEPSPQTHVSP